MPVLHVEAQVTANEILRAVEQLPAPELEQFVSDVLRLRARRGGAPVLSEEETDLFGQINGGLPEERYARFRDFVGRRREGTLTPDEHAELLRLSDEAERLNAKRIEALARLAQLRGKSLTALMDDMGIKAPAYE